MMRPIQIGLIAAIPAEVLTDALDAMTGDTIIGLPSKAPSVDRFISWGFWKMHWELGYIWHYLFGLARRIGTEAELGALLIAAISLFLVGYVNWVLLIAAINYSFRFLTPKPAR
jgi:hypothetical protein